MNDSSGNKNPAQSLVKPVLSSAPRFDHEKLDVYQLELQFIAWVTDLLEEVSKSAKGKTAEVCDQLDRASLSALLNTAEGNGKRQRQVRAKFFDDARGSGTECAVAWMRRSRNERPRNNEFSTARRFSSGLFQSFVCWLTGLMRRDN